MMRFRFVLVALGLSLGLVTSVPRADQTDPRLDALFAALAEATDPVDAVVIEGAIWEIWSRSGNPAVDRVFERGLDALEQRDLEGAAHAFDEVTHLAPRFAEGWNKLATVRYLLGEPDKSAAAIARALELEPRHFGALSGLGLVEESRGNDRAALDAVRRGLRIYPAEPSMRAFEQELRLRVEGEPI
jgi:predicted TPR repeat methyltransferase